MIQHLRRALTLAVLMTLLTGLAYPLVLTGLAQALMPRSADGSLIERGGAAIGSELIGQAFSSDRYFWARPSAAGKDGYDAVASSGSNLGPTSAKLMERVSADAARFRDDASGGALPADAVLASASGLDPHISPAFALMQVVRVAKTRGVAEDRVRQIVSDHTESRSLGVFGEPRVNVLLLNLTLDSLRRSGVGD